MEFILTFALAALAAMFYIGSYSKTHGTVNFTDFRSEFPVFRVELLTAVILVAGLFSMWFSVVAIGLVYGYGKWKGWQFSLYPFSEF